MKNFAGKKCKTNWRQRATHWQIEGSEQCNFSQHWHCVNFPEFCEFMISGSACWHFDISARLPWNVPVFWPPRFWYLDENLGEISRFWRPKTRRESRRHLGKFPWNFAEFLAGEIAESSVKISHGLWNVTNLGLLFKIFIKEEKGMGIYWDLK